jgi:CheY-like chemotaxis protein
MEKMLQRLAGEAVTMATNLQSGLGYVKANPGQMEQVMMNLVLNARDAMPRGGRLTIATTTVTQDKPSPHGSGPRQPGSYIVLSVRDTGSGMDAATQERLFEPFFTTKDEGQGTGLGMSIVKDIVEQSGGAIQLVSALDQGTTFTIYLPLTTEMPPVPEPRKAPGSDQPGGPVTILLVEDSQPLRFMLRTFLKTRGYEVLDAIDSVEALVVSAQHRGRIDILLTDVVMPDIDGPELMKRLIPSRPDLKVLYMSGYSAESREHFGISDTGAAFLQKPFTTEALSGKMRELLAR